MRGRKPKPTALHVLNGNPSKIKDLGKNEPKPVPIAPKCPHWLHKNAKKEWRRIAPQLERLGLLTQVDMAALAMYCEAWAQYRDAIEFIHKKGQVYATWERNMDGSVATDDRGQPILRHMQQWPQVGIANKQLKNIQSLCAEFGLTPSARGRIQVPGAAEGDDPMEALLSGVK